MVTDVIEEEEAFQAYAEQRRYASTLGRNCVGSASTRRREAERENMKGFKGNISRFVSVSSISNVNVFRYRAHLALFNLVRIVPNRIRVLFLPTYV